MKKLITMLLLIGAMNVFSQKVIKNINPLVKHIEHFIAQDTSVIKSDRVIRFVSIENKGEVYVKKNIEGTALSLMQIN